MKNKILLFVLLFLLTSMKSIAHKEWVHQYIVQEAYRFLEMELGGEIPELKNHIGLNYFGYGDENDPWAIPYVSVGAWREDLEDIVWGYGFNNHWNASSSHFWKADDGDNVLSNLNLPLSPDPENAYTKGRIYLFGGHWIIKEKKEFVLDLNKTILARLYSYDSLIDFFTTGHSYLDGYVDLDGNFVMFNPRIELNMNLTSAQNMGYLILGRVAHLLADMSVPAHVHNDTHNCSFPSYDGDSYELHMGGNEYNGCNDPHSSFPAQNWNRYTTKSQGSLIDLENLSNYDAIRKLFYTLNQLSDHFPSKGDNSHTVYGNNDLPNGTNNYLLVRYQILGSPPASVNYPDIANETFNYAIRATASLLYWFAKKTNLEFVPFPQSLSVSISGPSTAPCATGSWTAKVSGGYSPYSYSWYHMWTSSLTKSNEITPLKPIDYWTHVGTNSPQLNFYLCGGNSQLRVDVTDNKGTLVTAQYYVAGATGGGGGFVISKSTNNPLETITAVPEENGIEQNYPNPFNPSTTIKYQLKESGFVSLKVYDILGKEVAALVQENESAGFYNVNFDASNLTSGLYVYELRINGFVESKKMLLTK